MFAENRSARLRPTQRMQGIPGLEKSGDSISYYLGAINFEVILFKI
jgi:hypothetical protein